jgi:hypothetical protein
VLTGGGVVRLVACCPNSLTSSGETQSPRERQRSQARE